MLKIFRLSDRCVTDGRYTRDERNGSFRLNPPGGACSSGVRLSEAIHKLERSPWTIHAAFTVPRSFSSHGQRVFFQKYRRHSGTRVNTRCYNDYANRASRCLGRLVLVRVEICSTILMEKKQRTVGSCA